MASKMEQSKWELLVDVMTAYEEQKHKFSEWEVGFIEGKGPQDQYDSLYEKYEKYAEETKITDKQWGVIQRMYDKVILGIKPERR